MSQPQASSVDSDWPVECDDAEKTRLVLVQDGTEWELEYDNAELAALHNLARARGIHNASNGDDEERASAGFEEAPGLAPQGWSNGEDRRDHKEGVSPLDWLVVPLPGEWEFCDAEPATDKYPPRPCFAECPDTETGFEEPASTCAEGATRTAFDCGGESVWDENCCRRRYCPEGFPCDEGFECRPATSITPASYCWVGIGPDVDPADVDLDDAGAACSCVGAFNPPADVCFPVETQ